MSLNTVPGSVSYSTKSTSIFRLSAEEVVRLIQEAVRAEGYEGVIEVSMECSHREEFTGCEVTIINQKIREL